MSPVIELKSPGASQTSPSVLFIAGYRMPLISDDLPEPLTPVTTVMTLSGMVAFTPRRLFMRAPLIFMLMFHLRLPCGSGIDSSPLMYFMVWLSGYLATASLSMCVALPAKTISPPSLPASGPTSIR